MLKPRKVIWNQAAECYSAMCEDGGVAVLFPKDEEGVFRPLNENGNMIRTDRPAYGVGEWLVFEGGPWNGRETGRRTMKMSSQASSYDEALQRIAEVCNPFGSLGMSGAIAIQKCVLFIAHYVGEMMEAEEELRLSLSAISAPPAEIAERSGHSFSRNMPGVGYTKVYFVKVVTPTSSREIDVSFFPELGLWEIEIDFGPHGSEYCSSQIGGEGWVRQELSMPILSNGEVAWATVGPLLGGSLEWEPLDETEVVVVIRRPIQE